MGAEEADGLRRMIFRDGKVKDEGGRKLLQLESEGPWWGRLASMLALFTRA